MWVGFAFLFYGAAHAQSPETSPRIIELRISDGNIVGEGTIRISQGEDVELRWTTDEPLDIHLHGYDIEKMLVPGEDAGMNFKAYATGRFPITVHGSPGSHDHGDGERTLAYLEVYPE